MSHPFLSLFRVSAIACALAMSMSPQAHAANHGLTVEDMLKMERISSPTLAADGKHLAYTIRTTDLDHNKGHTEIWMQDLSHPTSAPVQLTRSDAGASAPMWAPSGDALYFLSSRSGSSQVWRLSLNGGEAVKVTNFPIDIDSFVISPKGDRIVVSIDAFVDCDTPACTVDRLDQQKKIKSDARLYKQLFVRHWDTWRNGRRPALFAQALKAGVADGDAVKLTGKLDGEQNEYTVSPDGETVAFTLKNVGREEAWSTNFDIFTVSIKGGTPRNLTSDNPALDTQPVFSPDGKTLAYRAMKKPGFESDRYSIVLIDLASGRKTRLAEQWDRSASDLKWSSDGKSLLVTADELGQHKLFSIETSSGKVTTLVNEGTVSAFDMQHDTLVYAKNDLSDGDQLFQLKAGKATQLTHVNADVLKDVKLGEYQQYSFAGANGDKVYGYVMKPWNAEPGKKYPVAFLVHGGPQGSFGNDWGYRWNPQFYAGAGYAVVFIDFHGSTGYGQAFTDSISGDWGGKPLTDLKLGLSAAAQQFPWIDDKNACALGASYGGFMMNWIAGNWNDGFKCIVNHSGIFDQRTMYYETEELWFNEWENGGTYFNVPRNFENVNPANFVTQWKTPTLVIHGELDFRVPVSQGLSTFTALQRRGIESQLLVFPDENHWILKPGNSQLWHHTVKAWLDQHLQH